MFESGQCAARAPSAASRFLLLNGIAYTSGMTNDTKKDDDAPKFGRLLAWLIAAVVFCGVLTWVMATFFPNFPG